MLSSNLSSSGDDRFAHLLQKPVFSFFLEIPAEENASPELPGLWQEIAGNGRIFGTIVSSRSENTPALVKTCEDTAAVTARPVLPVLSGKGIRRDEMQALITTLRKAGFRDFLAVTGDISDKHREAAEQEGLPLSKVPCEYLDSIETIRLLQQAGKDNVIGAAANPFCYTPESLQVQYAKICCKRNAGADFLVTQIGWDMKKHQELLWYLRSREMLTPVLAKISTLLDADGERADLGLPPGIAVPLWISANVTRESRQGTFIANQMKRTALMALGCKFLGYNGVVLSGIRTSAQLRQFLDEWEKLSGHLTTYQEWVVEEEREFQDVEMIPYHPVLTQKGPFYLYENLLRDQRDFDCMKTRCRMPEISAPSSKDLLTAFTNRKNLPESIRRFLEKFLPRASEESVAQCFGLDHRECPKRLLSGACGGMGIDGTCECGAHPCFFLHVLRMAQKQKCPEALESFPRGESRL